MCSAKPKTLLRTNRSRGSAEPKTNGRPALRPNCNRVSGLERRMSHKKDSPKSPTSAPLSLPIQNGTFRTKPSTFTPPVSPKLPSPRPPAIKRGKDPNYELNSSTEKVLTPRCIVKSTSSIKKSKKSGGSCGGAGVIAETLKKSSSLVIESPGSIAATRREQVAILQEQRKIRIAHYGRTKSAMLEGKVARVLDSSVGREQRRCSNITPNSDPINVAYHDEEWGVPVHDDKLLFELLVLTAAQVGSDWTSVLKKRETFKDAFSGFDAEAVSKYNDKKITSICANYSIELSLIRGAVDNATRILQIKKEFGSLAKYLWGFVNNKPVSTQYKSSQKIPVKTSKSESISKDMVRRGFRFVGPTVIYSFMQAAGLTNDHLITCPRHLQCLALAISQHPPAAPAL